MNHLLVVDDSPVDRMLAGQLLEKHTRHHVEFASSGLEALEHLEERLPLAVVTDLQMPELDGLGLVAAVRKDFPQVPVVLMTAHGSEDIALQALLAGAADFVPKSRLATELGRAISGILSMSGGDRPHAHLAQCLRYEQRRYELENDVMLIPPLVASLQQAVQDLGLVDATDRVRLAKALVEAIRNAIYHGNLELPPERVSATEQTSEPAADTDLLAERRQQSPYRERRVQVETVMSPDEVSVTVRDEGPGFDVSRAPSVRDDPSLLTRSDGRGLLLVRAFMDEVRFNDRGNEITLITRASRSGSPPPLPSWPQVSVALP